VALNLGEQPRRVSLSAAGARGSILCSTELDREGSVDLASLSLRPGEGVMMGLA
jgi:hypothetical protein